MLISKNKTCTVDNICLQEGSVDDTYYSANTPELIAKIMRFFPNFDFVTDENDWLIDVTPIGDYPLTNKEKIEKLEGENQLLTDCILEMSEILYGGEEE